MIAQHLGIGLWSDLLTARATSGIKAASVRLRRTHATCEPGFYCFKGAVQADRPRENVSTDVGPRGGAACSSVDDLETGSERRGRITPSCAVVNLTKGKNH
jgi:hypothetical protein